MSGRDAGYGGTADMRRPGVSSPQSRESIDPRIPLWVDLRMVPVNKRLTYLKAVADARAEHIIVGKGDPHLGREGAEFLIMDGKGTLRDARGTVVARTHHVHDKRSQERAMQAEGTIVVDASDWKVIPLENLVAARRDRPGTLFAVARTPSLARLFALTLELGVHGVVLEPASPTDILETDHQLRLAHGARGLVHEPIPEVRPAPETDAVATGPLRSETGAVVAPSTTAQPPTTASSSSPAGVAKSSAIQATATNPLTTAVPKTNGAGPQPSGVPSAPASSTRPSPTTPKTSHDGKGQTKGDLQSAGQHQGPAGLQPTTPQRTAERQPTPQHQAATGRPPATNHQAGAKQPNALTLESATIVSIEDAGAGDRVCVDTTSLFSDGEGLLIGSTASSFALVHAETAQSQFIASRPFRVNAGAVHSYVLSPAGKTKYLSELEAGQSVLAVRADGTSRELSIGRCKTERRPHSLIKWKAQDGAPGMAVLQTAETVCLVSPDGTRIPVTDLRPGASILVHRETTGRHAGMPADGHLDER